MNITTITSRPRVVNGEKTPTLLMAIRGNGGTLSLMLLSYDPNDDIVTYDSKAFNYLFKPTTLTDQLFQERRRIIYNNLFLIKTPAGNQWDIGHFDNFDMDELKTTLTENCDSGFDS